MNNKAKAVTSEQKKRETNEGREIAKALSAMPMLATQDFNVTISLNQFFGWLEEQHGQEHFRVDEMKIAIDHVLKLAETEKYTPRVSNLNLAPKFIISKSGSISIVFTCGPHEIKRVRKDQQVLEGFLEISGADFVRYSETKPRLFNATFTMSWAKSTTAMR